MEPVVFTQIVIAAATLLASLGGYLLAGLNERRRDARTLARELQLRGTERESRRDDEAHTFQREILLALQDAVQLMARLTYKAMHFDHMQAREGKYTHLPDTLSDDMHSNGVDVRRLASRVLDAGVRAAVDAFKDTSARLSISPRHLQGLVGDDLENRATSDIMELHEGFETLTAVLGEAVRREIAWRPPVE
ncbi:hypothetical protein [Arthrobacter sp.]|uniref:hypothetical protein n=1 Tax=Arthrobacter sp. TaxID=1667 RepID=UPI003A8EE807